MTHARTEHTRVADHVEGSGPPLVLIHGGMGSWTHWSRNLPALARHFEVHALDMPGCGDSDSVPADIPEDDYVAVVVRCMAGLAAGRPLRIAGFSFGGVVAAMTAARLGDAVARLSLLAPGGFGPVTGRRLDLRSMPEGNVDPAIEREVLRHNLMAMMLADPASADDEALAIQRANVRRTRFDSRRFSLSPWLLEALPRLTCPVQFIYGERDNLAWPDVGSRISRALAACPRARVDRIPGAGHWLQFEASAEVDRLLIEFLGAAPAP